jgi:acetyltransferase-like isoleucine patch superfamily enzyme
MTAAPPEPGRWTDGPLPANVEVGPGSLITGPHVFRRFRGKADRAVIIGAHSTLDNAHLAVGEPGCLIIGDYCLISAAVLLCELEVRIGSYVSMGWNVTIADSDFHPIDPALRQQDAIACSTLGAGRTRPPVERRPVLIEDDVWIGPGATILKGVRIGEGAVIEAGAMVTRDVPPGARILGNPARIAEGP